MISSAGLGEFRIRDLNDEINKLLREKKHWEERILELGGPDYEVRRRGGEGAVAFMHILCATGERDGKVERGGGGGRERGGGEVERGEKWREDMFVSSGYWSTENRAKDDGS